MSEFYKTMELANYKVADMSKNFFRYSGRSVWSPIGDYLNMTQNEFVARRIKALEDEIRNLKNKRNR